MQLWRIDLQSVAKWTRRKSSALSKVCYGAEVNCPNILSKNTIIAAKSWFFPPFFGGSIPGASKMHFLSQISLLLRKMAKMMKKILQWPPLQSPGGCQSVILLWILPTCLLIYLYEWALYNNLLDHRAIPEITGGRRKKRHFEADPNMSKTFQNACSIFC